MGTKEGGDGDPREPKGPSRVLEVTFLMPGQPWTQTRSAPACSWAWTGPGTGLWGRAATAATGALRPGSSSPCQRRTAWLFLLRLLGPTPQPLTKGWRSRGRKVSTSNVFCHNKLNRLEESALVRCLGFYYFLLILKFT